VLRALVPLQWSVNIGRPGSPRPPRRRGDERPTADNAFLPQLARLSAVRELATGIKLFRCRPLEDHVRFRYAPGQFGFLSAIGVGEAPFGHGGLRKPGSGAAPSSPCRRGHGHRCPARDARRATSSACAGRWGKGFPLDELKGKRIVILGGGIGLAPLRPLIQEILDHRADYGELTIFCAGRGPDLLVFREEYEEWAKAPRTVVHVTVDKGDDTWKGPSGSHHPGPRARSPRARRGRTP